MKKYFKVLFFALLINSGLQAQFNYSQVHYWVGAGSDTSILVVDFHGQTDSSFIWGYLHNGVTGEVMLNDIAAADSNFKINLTGGFLNDIIYKQDSGIGGSPDYWSTWSGSGADTFSLNQGVSAMLTNGAWFGCSYTDFNPAIPPREPEQVISGIINNSAYAAFQAFPNPAKNIIYLETATESLKYITIYDLAGKLVFEKLSDLQRETLDVSMLSRGIYFLKVDTATIKIIID